MAKKADSASYDKLRAEIKAGSIGGAYVFYGEESYLRDRTVEEIRKLLITPGTETFNLRVIGGSARPEDIAQAVDSFPMLGAHTLVIVRDLDLYKLSEGDQAAIMAVLEDVPDYCTLIFIYDTTPYKTDARRKIHAVLKKKATTVEFVLSDASKLVPWVRRHCRDGKKDIGAQDAEYLLFRVGLGMSALLGEVEKLIAFTQGDVITRADIDAVVVPSLEAESFSLTQTLCEGKNAEAFDLLDRLFLLRQEPIAVLGAMGWQLRRFYVASLTAEARGGVRELMARCPGMSPYSARMTMQTAAQLTPAWCRSALQLCAAADYDLKSAAEDERGVLELLLLRLAEEKRNVENQAGRRR